MNEIIEKIDSATHIVILSHDAYNAHTIANASAFYTFLLQKHKKVSWVCETHNIDFKLTFIPWVKDIKSSFAKSADLVISFDTCSKEHVDVELVNFTIKTETLYQFFKENEIKINKKMATALYAGLLYETDGFLSNELCGTTFATAKELIENGADFKLCNKNIMKTTTLGALRLKAIMFKNMLLEHDAKIALFCVSDEDMRASGAVLHDAKAVLKESLFLVHVEVALLLIQENDFKIRCLIYCNSDVNCKKIAPHFSAKVAENYLSFELASIVSLHVAKELVLNIVKKEI